MKKYLILFFISIFIYSIHFAVTKHGIYGDGNGYYSLAHTLFFQRKLNFKPIYQHLSHFQGAHYVFSRVFWDTSNTNTYVNNCPWLIGTALFWIPAIFLTSIVNLILYSHTYMFHPIYEAVCGTIGILLVLFGLRLLELFLKKYFDSKTSSITIIALFTASQLFYYSTFEPALSHQPAYLLVCLFIFLYQRGYKEVKKSLCMGLIFGLLFITRIGDVVLLVPTLLIVFYSWIKERRLVNLGLFLIALLIAVTPQLILQYFMYGNPFQNPYLQGEKGTFTFISISSLLIHLFSPAGGFLLWSPIFIPSLAAFIFMRKKVKYRKIATLFLITIITYIVFISIWTGIIPAGFGNRFFISAVPFFSFGLAYVISIFNKKAFIYLSICFIWNSLLLTYFLIQ